MLATELYACRQEGVSDRQSMLSIYFPRSCLCAGSTCYILPPRRVRRMLMNTSISALAGLIPLAGDVVIAVFKANSRNAALLQEFLPDPWGRIHEGRK